MKILAMATATLVPMAMPTTCRKYRSSLPVLKVKMFSLRIKSSSWISCWLLGVGQQPLRLWSALAAAILASLIGILV